MLVVITGSLIFTACIGFVRAWPYGTSDLLLILPNSGDCPKPCWQGIQPGVTTVAEAIRLLEEHEWVDQVRGGDTRIRWTWSGQQSALIDGEQPGRLTAQNQLIVSIDIPLKIGMGDLVLLFGYPHWRSTNRADQTVIVHLSYPGEYLALSVTSRCAATRAAFWLAQPEITLQNQPAFGSRFTPELLGRSLDC